MRVRISYSVELEDVPLECARMLHDSMEKIESIREEISDLIKQLDDGKAQAWIVKDRLHNHGKKCAH